MPPKPKFSKEEVVTAALEIVSEKGIEALTAREVGERLGSSPRPIFTVFKNMEELSYEVKAAAMKRFEGYIREADGYKPYLKKIGMQMIHFACEEPKLFQLLFMSENKTATCFDDVVNLLGVAADMCLELIHKRFGLDEKDTRNFFEQLWIFTYGISSLCAVGMCKFSEEELSRIMGVQYAAMAALEDEGRLNEPITVPKKNVDKSLA